MIIRLFSRENKLYAFKIGHYNSQGEWESFAVFYADLGREELARDEAMAMLHYLNGGKQ